jgi:hypothetical protein
MKKQETTMWVDGVQLSRVDGEHYIPTAVCSEEKETAIGAGAVSKVDRIVNRNFKVELGDYKRNVELSKKTFLTEAGKSVNAFELSRMFFDGVLRDVEDRIVKDSSEEWKVPAKIMVAEPLACNGLINL